MKKFAQAFVAVWKGELLALIIMLALAGIVYVIGNIW